VNQIVRLLIGALDHVIPLGTSLDYGNSNSVELFVLFEMVNWFVKRTNALGSSTSGALRMALKR